MNILIIEDEYSLADAISETLKNEKFNACIKTDGEEGEDEALTENYDLILLDVMLPNKNGFDILKDLRQAKIKTPVIMLTAKSEMEDKLNGVDQKKDMDFGLPIAKGIVEKYKGSIYATSKDGFTSFIIKI